MVTMVETRVGKVAYSDVGEGPAVVLLHATLQAVDSKIYKQVKGNEPSYLF